MISNLLQGMPVFDGIFVQGELTSPGTAVQFPTEQAGIVKIKASADNTGSVYIGGVSGTTVANGTTDTTTGFELAPGDTDYFFVKQLSDLFLIAATSGDGVTYIVYQL